VEYVPLGEKNQKELQFRRESVVNPGFSPDNERNLLLEKSYQMKRRALETKVLQRSSFYLYFY
jgi:hypothetical protein